MVDVALTVSPRDAVRVIVNGAVACEVAAVSVQTRDDLRAEVERARCAMALIAIVGGVLRELERCDRFGWEDHVNTSFAAKRDAYIAGLIDGLRGATVEHPYGSLLPPLPPRADRSYRHGYSAGEGVRNAATRADSRRLDVAQEAAS